MTFDRIVFWTPFALVGLALVAWSVLSMKGCTYRQSDVVAIAQADQHHVSAATAGAQGAVHDQAIVADEKEVQKLRADVSRLKAELAAAKAKLASHGQSLPIADGGLDSGTPAGDPAALVADLTGVIEAQDKVIAAQDEQIQAQDRTILDLTSARDSYKLAFTESQKESAALRIAHDAAVAAQDSQRWRGRLEGGGVIGATWAIARLLGGI